MVELPRLFLYELVKLPYEQWQKGRHQQPSRQRLKKQGVMTGSSRTGSLMHASSGAA